MSVTVAGAAGIIARASSGCCGKVVVPVYLLLQMILFVVKLVLFAACNITTICFRFRLFLGVNCTVFAFELIVMSAKVTLISADLIV